MEKLSVQRSIWINAPRERVWQAITEAKQIEQWWGDNWEISASQVGGAVKFYGDAEDEAAIATIEVFDAPRQFTMHRQPIERFPVNTMVTTFVLENENGGTRVTVTESGFEALPDDIRQKRADQTGEGYTTVLGALKALVEGTIVAAQGGH